MTVTNQITMDLKRKGPMPRIHAVQGDCYSRVVEVTLLSDGESWAVPEDATVAVGYGKPDGTGGVYDTLPDGTQAWSVSENVITITLAPQMLTAAGCVQAQVEVLEGDARIATFPFQVLVARKLGGEQSVDYVNWRYAFLPQIAGAKVGQFVQIEEVDASGRVTKLSPVDISLEGLGATLVPAYVEKEAQRVAKLANTYQGGSTLTFAAVSDSHYGSGDYTDGITHLGQALDIIGKQTKLDFFAHFGDYVTGGGEDTLVGSTADFENSNAALGLGVRAVPNIRMNGNHDILPYNTDGMFSTNQLYGWIGKWNDENVVTEFGNEKRNYGYLDFTKQKIRVIFLNTSDLDGETAAVGTALANDHKISGAQFEWFANTALDLTGKADAADWAVILLSHFPCMWYGEPTKIQTIVNAYCDGTSGSITSDGTTVSYDYAGKNSAPILAYFHGHVHCFKVGTFGTAGIPRISIPNACFGRENEYGQDGNYTVGEETTYSKTADSAKDTSFNIITVDREQKLIHCANYGAGYDRVVPFADNAAVYYTVSSDLEHVFISDDTASVVHGAAYSVYLTAETGYTLDSVSVTMGGEDVTSTVYSNGKVTISAVTGDVAISAAAVETAAGGYTNQIPLSTDAEGNPYNGGLGYKQGYRVSTSSGGESVATGMCVTGYIAVPHGCIVRTRDIDFTDSDATFAWYNADYSMNSSGYCNKYFEEDGVSGVSQCTNTMAADGFLRLSGAFGDDPIVTVNEEIT